MKIYFNQAHINYYKIRINLVLCLCRLLTSECFLALDICK